MKKKISQFKYFIFILFPILSHAQDTDFQNWHNIEIVYKIDKKSNISLDNGIRFSEGVSKCFSDLSFKRNVSNKFNYRLGFRFLLNKKNNIFENKERYYVDVSFKDGFSKKIKYSFRTRLQAQFDSSFNFNQDIKSKLRQKVKFVYVLKSLDVDIFSSVEGFYFINNDLDKIRFQLGFLKGIIQNMTLVISYLFENKFSDNIALSALRTKLVYKF